MSGPEYLASLPMYALPGQASAIAAFWQDIVAGLRERGIDAPIRFVEPDGSDHLDLLADPRLIFSQSCWGPIESGVLPDLHILAQPDYSRVPGGHGAQYRSAIVARKPGEDIAVPRGTAAVLPEGNLGRFAANDLTSRSGALAVFEDWLNAGRSAPKVDLVTGGHLASVQAVAEGRADWAAIDCLTWALLQGVEPACDNLRIAGWTGARMGLPYVCHPAIAPNIKTAMTEVLVEKGALPCDA